MLKTLLIDFIKIAFVIGALMVGVAYTVLAERKVSAWIQDRLGPNRVGPFGIFQPFADFLKLLVKEDLLPAYVHKPFFLLAPALVVIPPLLIASVIPWGSYLGTIPCVIADLDVGLLFVFATASLTVYGIVLAGWSSNSKYPLIGGIRSSAQLISYEVCLGLSVVGLVMQTGTLNMGHIVEYQAAHGWLIMYQPLAFFVFFIGTFAETNRLPFDFPEAEQELVSGYHTEYSSGKFALFYMGEYANLAIVSALTTTLFLGGWSLPFAPFNAPAQTLLVGFAHLGIFVAKVVMFLFIYIWVRWTFPRLRYDQLMKFGWTVLIPLALVSIVLTGAMLWWLK